jgi:hypothetical protein
MLEQVEQFIINQSNLSDSIMFLIEQEIVKNGVRDLGKFIPQDRTAEYWDNYLRKIAQDKNKTNTNKTKEVVQKTVSNLDVEKEKKEAEQIIIPSCYDDI